MHTRVVPRAFWQSPVDNLNPFLHSSIAEVLDTRCVTANSNGVRQFNALCGRCSLCRSDLRCRRFTVCSSAMERAMVKRIDAKPGGGRERATGKSEVEHPVAHRREDHSERLGPLAIMNRDFH